MRQYVRSEKRRVIWKIGEVGEGLASAEAAAEIGSRVFPLPAPPAATMPSVARKSSTRVFVPKGSVTKKPGIGNSSTRVLRSGKRLAVSEHVEKTGDRDFFGSPDIRLWERNGQNENGLSEQILPECDAIEKSATPLQGPGKMFEIVYCRKRRRIPSVGCVSLDTSSSNKDRMFGIVFSRKHNKKKPDLNVDELDGCEEFLVRDGVRQVCLQITESTRSLFKAAGNTRSELCCNTSDQPVILVLIEASSNSTFWFGNFLISLVLRMRNGRMRLRSLVAVLLSGPVSTVLPRHGIHFLPLTHRNRVSFLHLLSICLKFSVILIPPFSLFQKFLHGSSVSNLGACKIDGSRESLPLLSVNFSALPSYFQGLHLVALLGSQYLPSALRRTYLPFRCGDDQCHVPMDTDFSGTLMLASVNPNMRTDRSLSVVEASALTARSAGILLHGSRPRKLQKRRSFFRDSRRTLRSTRNNRGIISLGSVHGKNVATFLDDPGQMSPSRGTLSKLKRVSRKSYGEQMKEMKSILSEIRQNVDAIHCNANILVTKGDRCWREEGAQVMLEMSSSGDWCLAVKISGILKYLHKPQDVKCSFNRLNQAHMWVCEDGWRLEFCEKWDWLSFKELIAECLQRNIHPKEDNSVRIIPVPVFHVVPDYEDDTIVTFERPEQYIRMKHDDEILRAMVSDVPHYDMDSEDEEWLNRQNSGFLNLDSGAQSYVSGDSFERMIFAFERDAYYTPSKVLLLENELNGFEELGSKDRLAIVYDYWLKKRKQKQAPLVRVFQGLSVRKPQLLQKSVLRKRRSFKRQRSQVLRGNPSSKAAEVARSEAKIKVHEAQDAWRRAVDVAIPLRWRAQLLMGNADLAAYRSAMALRIAEAIKAASEESDASSILDCFLEL
ncbi:hypothetical protein AXF42_Ash003690 [Apostasia shenzhenica]|uniref:Enhancer of polycomb-like protein n=1 Tax=Apostasia shenzhenica TaxID=1088818 RepID=A0A2I0AHM0_9ASPA|nr:hypothetical protein AXF42_Ash003690 [Apostasia shenzhenica]